MAVVVPVLAAVGGGSATAGAILLGAAAATVASGVISAQQSRAAGKMKEAQSKIDANAEGDAAREREIKRKRNLLRAISSQQAAAAAGGVSFSEGSPAAIGRLDISQANRDARIDNANTKQKQQALRQRGRAARIQGNAQSAMTLLDTAARAGSTVAGRL